MQNGSGRSVSFVGPATDGNSLGPEWRFDRSNQRVPSFRIAGPGTGREPKALLHKLTSMLTAADWVRFWDAQAELLVVDLGRCRVY